MIVVFGGVGRGFGGVETGLCPREAYFVEREGQVEVVAYGEAPYLSPDAGRQPLPPKVARFFGFVPGKLKFNILV